MQQEMNLKALTERRELELRTLGWSKSDFEVSMVLVSNDAYAVAETQHEKVFILHYKRPSHDEARLIEMVINAFRHSDEEYDERIIEDLMSEYCEANYLKITRQQADNLKDYIAKETKGHSIFDCLLEIEDLEEVTVHEVGKNIFVYHKDFGWLKTNIVFENEQKLIDIINKMARPLGRRITRKSPRINASLDFGRLHASSRPLAKTTNMTIRKFRHNPFTVDELVANSTMSLAAADFLKKSIAMDSNILICGNTGSGKTSLLNALINCIQLNQRLIIVEETPEIRAGHYHQVSLAVDESINVGMHDLITDTLRMRPDKVIVGEVRTAQEFKALMNTMLSGHGKGSIATMHAHSAEEALMRIKNQGIDVQDLTTIDFIVVQKRITTPEGLDKRRVTEICSVESGSKGPVLKHIFRFNEKTDELEAC